MPSDRDIYVCPQVSSHSRPTPFHQVHRSADSILNGKSAMFQMFSVGVLAITLGISSVVSGLGTLCSAPLTQGTAAPTDPYWMETIKHQGIAAFNPNPATYQVFRNVKVSSSSELLTYNSLFLGFRSKRRRCYR